MLALNHGRRDVCDGATPLLHHRCAQPLGVPLPGIRLLDDLVRNHIIGDVVAIKKPKRYQCDFICKTHDPDRLRVESLAIEVKSNRHAHFPVKGRECAHVYSKMGLLTVQYCSLWHLGLVG